MPNYVSNIIKMGGIANLPLFSVEDGEKTFDFNKIIPMPESLNIESGSVTDQAIIYYMTERCTVPLKCLDEKDRAIIDATVTNMLSKNWPQEVFTRVSEWAYKATTDQKEAMYAKGKIYVDNYRNYGDVTWYGWCCRNWGTKWNAGTTRIDADEICFNTAWSTPEPVILKLSEMYPDTEIELLWADEDSGANTGHAFYKNGARISGGPAENFSDEAYSICEQCW